MLRCFTMSSMYKALSAERKELQKHCHLPDWMTTGGWQLFKEKYLHEAIGLDDTYERIAKVMASHMPDPMYWEPIFFELMWKGWLALSTPVLSNAGTKKGNVVSCSGQYVGDSINEFYKSYHETAMLTKHGFGTSAYLGDIRERGAPISVGGTASGILPVLKHFVQDMRDVAQGTSRRGAWAGYVPMEHSDFWEVSDYLANYPDDLNVGWTVSDEFVARLNAKDKEAVKRFQRAMKIRSVLGKGYFVFTDKINRASPEFYEDLGYEVLASNLCTEITLYSNEFETFTCVLSSMNLAKWPEWKDTDAVFNSIVFLDCVASEFIKLAQHKRGFAKAIRFTERNRALGLGALGFHTLLQQNMIPFESLDAHMLNNEIFSHVKTEAVKATEWLAKELGEPDNLIGSGKRNSHLLAVAPNTSSALICGGVSQGIEPVVANVYNQQTAGGNIYRVNPVFLRLAKERVGWTDELKQSIIDNFGSVQHLDWLAEEEKLVFKTAYEIDQRAIIRLAAARQKHICQGQSLNLFFSADEKEEYIAEVHKEAFLNEDIKALYYMRTQAGVQASKNECIACEG